MERSRIRSKCCCIDVRTDKMPQMVAFLWQTIIRKPHRLWPTIADRTNASCARKREFCAFIYQITIIMLTLSLVILLCSFKTHIRMIKHRTVHTGHKPYMCEQCGREFRERSTLREHVRIHTGAMPFACDFCGKRFRFKGVLTVTVSYAILYVCTIRK